MPPEITASSLALLLLANFGGIIWAAVHVTSRLTRLETHLDILLRKEGIGHGRGE